MKKVTLLAIAIMFSIGTAFAAHSNNPVSDTTKTKKTKSDKVVYTCPMHTDVVSYKPGKCPKTRLRYDDGKKERPEKETGTNENVIAFQPFANRRRAD